MIPFKSLQVSKGIFSYTYKPVGHYQLGIQDTFVIDLCGRAWPVISIKILFSISDVIDMLLFQYWLSSVEPLG